MRGKSFDLTSSGGVLGDGVGLDVDESLADESLKGETEITDDDGDGVDGKRKTLSCSMFSGAAMGGGRRRRSGVDGSWSSRWVWTSPSLMSLFSGNDQDGDQNMIT